MNVELAAALTAFGANMRRDPFAFMATTQFVVRRPLAFGTSAPVGAAAANL